LKAAQARAKTAVWSQTSSSRLLFWPVLFLGVRMPPKFTRCVSRGGKVRTKSLAGGKYIKICIPKGGGKSVAGEVHKKKK
jgi:hypothetical protein